jgi:hypothetical protein
VRADWGALRVKVVRANRSSAAQQLPVLVQHNRRILVSRLAIHGPGPPAGGSPAA